MTIQPHCKVGLFFESTITDYMINYINGDLFKVTNGVIAHGCNCLGVMGAGVAKIVRERYPEAYTRYYFTCVTYSPDDLLGVAQIIKVTKDLYIANCFTQKSVAKRSMSSTKQADTDAILESMQYVAEFCNDNGIETISMPKIGAGLGGLDWDTEVEPIIRQLSLKFSNIRFDVYYI